MQEDYIISVKGVQTSYEGTDKIDLKVSGSYRTDDNGQYISYHDYDENSENESLVELTICNNMLTMNRIGDYSINLMIECGKHYKTIYDTPMGSIKVGVYTYTLDNKLGDNGGTIYACYSVDYGSVVASKNELFIEVEPKNKLNQ